jgi:phage FluMu protein Com
MKDYMKKYYESNSEEVQCKVCNKIVKKYTYYAHLKSKVHRNSIQNEAIEVNQ